MGGGTYSHAAYAGRTATLRSHGYHSRFTHTEDIAAGRAARRVHQRLDPSGLRVRESRDSAEHPNSLAIAVFFDVTGSMGRAARVVSENLNTLMGLLTSRGYVADPQVLFAAVGDATCDAVPLQVGQFESDIRMDEDLGAVYLEGGGGGQATESYELAFYVAARHTALDCLERRGKKGYLFTIGDEMPYPAVSRQQVRDLIGGGLQHDVPTADILREAQQKYHVFHVIATQGSQGRNPEVEREWRRLLGDHVIRLDDMGDTSELLALVVGLSEGTVDLETATRHLTELGVAEASVARLRTAAEPVLRAITLRA